MDVRKIIGNPIIGRMYRVPCIIIEELILDDEDGYVDIFERNGHAYKRVYIPVIDHPHSDIENGQNYLHYHTDYRFIPQGSSKDMRYQLKTFQKVLSMPLAVLSRYNSNDLKDPFKIVLKDLRCYHRINQFVTIPSFITKSKLKHNCIHKGKCPHRGYDLSSSTGVNGVITCPLHGLQFDATTKELLNHPNPA